MNFHFIELTGTPRAVCILSGGLDSTCYAALLAKDYDIYLITFAYGQRAIREIERARYFAKVLKAKDHKVVDISFMKSLYGGSNALTDSRSRRTRERHNPDRRGFRDSPGPAGGRCAARSSRPVGRANRCRRAAHLRFHSGTAERTHPGAD